MDLTKNKYIQSGSKYILGFGGAAFTYFTVRFLKRTFVDQHMNYTKENLRKYLPDDQIDAIAKDEEYFSIVSRLAEFAPLDPYNFSNVVKAIQATLIFFEKVNTEGVTMTRAYEYVHHAQLVIENVRLMRAFLELSMPSCLDDFDEVAIDIQTKYEQDNEAILMDAQLKY